MPRDHQWLSELFMAGIPCKKRWTLNLINLDESAPDINASTLILALTDLYAIGARVEIDEIGLSGKSLALAQCVDLLRRHGGLKRLSLRSTDKQHGFMKTTGDLLPAVLRMTSFNRSLIGLEFVSFSVLIHASYFPILPSNQNICSICISGLEEPATYNNRVCCSLSLSGRLNELLPRE